LFSQASPLWQVWSGLQAQPAVPSGQARQAPFSHRKPFSQAAVGVQRQVALPGMQSLFSGVGSLASGLVSAVLGWQEPWVHESPEAQSLLAAQAQPSCVQVWSGFPPSGLLGGVQAEKTTEKENHAPNNKKATVRDEAFMQKTFRETALRGDNAS